MKNKDYTSDPGTLKEADVPKKVKLGDSIGALLIQKGYLTEEKLDYVKRVQSKLATPKSIIQILKELNFLTDDQIKQTLKLSQERVKFGDLLVELGYISENDLKSALNIQKQQKNKKKLGEILVELNLMSETRLIELLSLQIDCLHIEPDFRKVNHALFVKGSIKTYQSYEFIPYHIQDGNVIVIFRDPLDTRTRETATQIFGKSIIPAIATSKSIQFAIKSVQHSIHDVQSVKAYDDQTVVGIVNHMILDAIHEKASDIHIEPTPEQLRIRFRCDGVLVPYKDFSREIIPSLTSRIKILAKADIAEKRRHQDGRILFEDERSGETMDLRTSFYVTIHGEKIVLRLLNSRGELLSLQQIGMAPKMLNHFREDVLDVPSGVVIITGPTGSGKTTTLYGCVNYLNDPHTSIITAEDPVEYVIDGVAQCSINPKINITYEETLRHIVRQDPDVIILGEIRDRFSADTAIQAALTGHKVLTTFHTEDSIGGILRLMNMDIEAFLISSTVVSVVAQRLLRRVCEHCAAPDTVTTSILRRLGYANHALQGAKPMRGQGCAQCRFTGYRGRISVFELLVLNEVVKDAILNHRTSYEIRRISLETSNLVTLVEDGIVKACQGLTTFDQVIRYLPRLNKPRPLPELQMLLGFK